MAIGDAGVGQLRGKLVLGKPLLVRDWNRADIEHQSDA
jgi:hypothetical protein